MIERMSDIGNIRKLNEDTYGVLEEEIFNLFVICDGMGGHNAGEVASEMAKEILLEKMAGLKDQESFLPSLQEAIGLANDKIYALAAKEKTMSGMGTTVTAVVTTAAKLLVAHVGDSGLYVLRAGTLEKVTKDHSYVQELVDLGKISEEEAKSHPNKNIITRAVGTNANIQVDVYERELSPEDLCLLCTDGLSDYLSRREMGDILLSYEPKVAMEKLVHVAKERGGRDNITLVIFGGEALK